MKKQKTQSKIIVALTAVVILLVAISATLTFAYFTATANETSDSLTFGKMGLHIDSYEMELADAAGVSCTVNNLVPGCSFKGDGEIQIKNNIDTFLRFRIGMTDFANAQGAGDVSNSDAYAMLFDDTTNNVLNVDLAENGENTFIKGATAAAAGYTAYYYTFVPADTNFATTTVMSLERIVFNIPTSIGNSFQGASFKLILEVQAIQAEHIGTTAVIDGNDTGDDTLISTIGNLESSAVWSNAAQIDYFPAPANNP